MFTTDDGSISLTSPLFNEAYHSKFGAADESRHVFINAGLREWYRRHPKKSRELRIFEMGFGTGLNAILTLQWAHDLKRHVAYHAIDLYPLADDQLKALNHVDFVCKDLRGKVRKIQFSEWNISTKISKYFTLYKQQISLLDVQLADNFFDVIFFDAFSPKAQPELWTEDVFCKISKSAHKNAILTTYCVKGDVRRALQTAGFEVKKIPGPVGKREMIQAIKQS